MKDLARAALALLGIRTPITAPSGGYRRPRETRHDQVHGMYEEDQ